MKVDLDKYQNKAVNINEKNVLVVAAPGSGKTTVIINRVNHLVTNLKVKIGNIIVITFTRAAADNMRTRYKNVFNREVAPFFGTFHGLF
ncbi:MAG: UvrD-helicase domain-containing protein, partial [Clostridium sp.]